MRSQSRTRKRFELTEQELIARADPEINIHYIRMNE